MKWRVLRKAAQDLEDIRSYIAADSDAAAVLVIARLKKSFELIAERPEVGRPTPHLAVREWSVPGLPYVIPYRVRGDIVEVLRVFHTSRQRPSRWIG